MSKFKPRDKVRVTEVDEWDEECGIKVGMEGVVVKELEHSGFICINFIDDEIDFDDFYKVDLLKRKVIYEECLEIVKEGEKK